MKKRKVPKLRFKGFEGEWEEKKLDNLATFKKGKGYTKKDLQEKGVPIILYGRLYTKYETVIDEVDTFVEEAENSLKSIGGEVIIPASGESPTEIAVASVVKRKGVILGGDLNVIYPNNKLVSTYLALSLSNGENKKRISRIAQGATITHIKNDDLKKLKIIYPSIKEQEKIGQVFEKLDRLIELQEKTIEEEKRLKKALLQKMFPKKGQRVPEIRFVGFTGEWEEVKLKKIAKRITRKNTDLSSRLPLTISAQMGLVAQDEFFDNRIASKDISGYYKILKGEFAYNKSYSKGYPYGAIKRLEKYDDGVLSTLYILFEIEKGNSDFFKYYFESTYWHKEIIKISAEGARNHGLLNIPIKDFFSINIILPSLPEQKKIGEIFKKIDVKIELEEKTLAAYQNLKKSLLQKMFV